MENTNINDVLEDVIEEVTEDFNTDEVYADLTLEEVSDDIEERIELSEDDLDDINGGLNVVQGAIAAAVFAATVSSAGVANPVQSNAAVAPTQVTTQATVGAVANHNVTVKAISKTLRITSGGVNVRTQPWVGTGSKVVGALGTGSVVKVTGQVYKNGHMADWYRINYKGQVRYISKSFSSSTVQTNGKTNTVTPQKAVVTPRATMKVSGVTNYLGIRSRMSTDDRYEVGQANNGQTVKVLDHSNKTFYRISTKDRVTGKTVTGYVLAQFLR